MPEIAAAPSVIIDACGLSDRGKVRTANQDYFVVAAVQKSVAIQHSNVPDDVLAHRFGATECHLLAVADGVGGRPEGDVASERTIAGLLDYVGRTAGCFHGLDVAGEHDLLTRLEQTVRAVHEGLLQEYGRGDRVPATTLTLLLLVWPRAYLMHVGDSRAYVHRGGRLRQLTRDQTFGEYMVALGAWSEEQAARAPASGNLSSAVGGSEITPVIGLVDLDPGDSVLLCTDGLYKHVADEEITRVLGESSGSETACRTLVELALAGGGTDNVTVVVVKTRPD